MAPECFVPGGVISEKADIWSMACCLIEIFGGPIPHESDYNNTAVIHKILHAQEAPDVPVWFHPTIRQVLLKVSRMIDLSPQICRRIWPSLLVCRQCFNRDASLRPSAQAVERVLAQVEAEDIENYGRSNG